MNINAKATEIVAGVIVKDKKVLVNNSYKRMLEHESSLEKIHRNRKQNNRK